MEIEYTPEEYLYNIIKYLDNKDGKNLMICCKSHYANMKIYYRNREFEIKELEKIPEEGKREITRVRGVREIKGIEKYKKLKKIEFDWEYNKELEGIPESVEEIELGFKFNKTIEELPEKIKKIKLGLTYKRRITKLPRELEILKLGYLYNEPLEIRGLKKLKKITVRGFFNQSLEGLPESVEEIKLSEHYRKKIKKLPKKIKKIKLHEGQEKLIEERERRRIKIEYIKY